MQKIQTILPRGSIEHLSITGDVVKFESYQKQQDEVLGGIKLKCRQVDYDGNAVWARGGKDCFAIIDNSKRLNPQNSGPLQSKRSVLCAFVGF